MLEPRHDNPTYYQSRYEQRGYSFGGDPYYRNDLRSQSRLDNWPYSWLNNTYRNNRSASHWLWLNDSRTRFQLNPSFGFNHIHNRDCYDRFGRHLAFNGQLRSPGFIGNPSRSTFLRPTDPTRNYLYERNRVNSNLPSARAQLEAQAAARAQQAQRAEQIQRAQQAQRAQQIQRA